jgi:hypothetical protein
MHLQAERLARQLADAAKGALHAVALQDGGVGGEACGQAGDSWLFWSGPLRNPDGRYNKYTYIW